MTTKVTHKGKNLRNQYGNPNLKFHSVCVDNFFNNPDLIREFALNQEYFPTDGRYPGERTSNMWQINKTLSDYLFAKIFSSMPEEFSTTTQIAFSFSIIISFTFVCNNNFSSELFFCGSTKAEAADDLLPFRFINW